MPVESDNDRVSLLADFGVMATWVPSSGAQAVSAPVLFDEPDVLNDYGGARRRFRITFQTAEFPGLSNGEIVSMAGKNYVVTAPEQVSDGMFSIAYATREDFRP